MSDATKDILFAEICGVVEACEEAKEALGSEYKITQAELTAYKEIRELLNVKKEV